MPRSKFSDCLRFAVAVPIQIEKQAHSEVWPLPEFQSISGKGKDENTKAAKANLNALEYLVFEKAVRDSEFGAILNEANPKKPIVTVTLPASFRHSIVSDRVREIRSHPDFRIARRALTISRLAQVISERRVQGGLRRVLLTQAKRLQWLAERRYTLLGGEASVSEEEGESDSAS